MKLTKENKVVIISLGVVLAIGLSFFIFGEENKSDFNLPNEFRSSYKQTLDSGQTLVNLINNINNKIKEINELDRLNENQRALEVVKEAKEITEEAKKEALNLSVNLEELTGTVSEIESTLAQNYALESVSINSAIVQEFLNYTSGLDDLLSTIDVAIRTDSFNDRLSITSKIENLNNRNSHINQLSQLLLFKTSQLGLLNETVSLDNVEVN